MQLCADGTDRPLNGIARDHRIVDFTYCSLCRLTYNGKVKVAWVWELLISCRCNHADFGCLHKCVVL